MTAGLKRPEEKKKSAFHNYYQSRYNLAEPSITSTDAKEYPSIYSQAEAEAQGDVEQSCSVGNIGNGVVLVRGLVSGVRRIGHLSSGKCKEKKHKSANELANGGYKVVSNFIGEMAYQWEIELLPMNGASDVHCC